MYTLKNKVQLIGRLGKDPEVKHIGKDRKYARFMLATNESYRNLAGEKITETQWHTLVAWGKLADLVEQYLQKSKEVAIEGKLTNRSYTDKQGIKRYVTEVLVTEMLLIRTSLQ
jgi:single-strand DNA-binding protein